jgi:Rrf2 family transcriptional regulator, iron-sulfur cluster assembly transcription factor
MKLSTKSRYGTRMILDLAQHHGQGAIQLREIAKRQKISLKYLEQIIRPLKQAGYVRSFRGAKGGHMLNKLPHEITVGEVVALLEGGETLIQCDRDPATCEQIDSCLTRYLWMEAAKAMYTRLTEITFADVLSLQEVVCKEQFFEYLTSEEQSSPAVS